MQINGINFERPGVFRFLVTSLFLLIFTSVYGQPVKLHYDIGFHYTQFRVNHLEGISDGRPGIKSRLGAAYLFGDDDRLSVGVEIGFYSRRMQRSLDNYKLINRFYTLEAPVFFRVELSDQWDVESGMAFLFFFTDQSALRNTAADTRIMVGSGFRNFDVAPFIGAAYQFSEHLSAGCRARFGLRNMVEFQKVGDFGSLEPLQADLRSNTFEVFLRITTF